jgi:CheY-like chemotaxis protein
MRRALADQRIDLVVLDLMLPGEDSYALLRIQAVRTALVDSNSTRTESCVVTRSDPEAQARSTPPKAKDHNGCQQIIRPSREMGAGLKILVSAVQSRPSPPFRFQS